MRHTKASVLRDLSDPSIDDRLDGVSPPPDEKPAVRKQQKELVKIATGQFNAYEVLSPTKDSGLSCGFKDRRKS